MSTTALLPQQSRRGLLISAGAACVPVAALAKDPVTLDADTVKKYRAIAKAEENMTKEQKSDYVKKLCDLGVFGPSILGALLCR